MGGFVSGTEGENEEADAGESYCRGDGRTERGFEGYRGRRNGEVMGEEGKMKGWMTIDDGSRIMCERWLVCR